VPPDSTPWVTTGFGIDVGPICSREVSMRVGSFRTAIWAVVLAAVPVSGPATAWGCVLDAQGAQACGGCFDTITGACTGDPCSNDQPCPAFNTFCTTKCAAPPPCEKDHDCDDGEVCTADVCIEGVCEHLCVCWSCPVDR
jgi:hypothetical protein